MMRTRHCSLLLLLAPVAADAVPPPTPADLAGCEGSAFVVDKLVCADPALKAADARARVPDADQARLLDTASDYVEPQDAWFQRRNRCAFAADQPACLRDAYAERTAVLAALAHDPAQDRPGLCGKVPVRIGQVGNAAIIRDDSRLVAVALPSSRSPWRPFVTVELRGGTLRLRRLDGVQMDCR
ncbi:hypothetical protein PMI04_004595 [Sphingobium sp. AP49]|uniref:hypothetical protein n=1 Tax=Sphingobium sp. AP49 TaxID=1144307 RepID=UPI00030244FF|nr:hypothetical protein [Sphingobium sp. AP49]WHO39877.1 hypothetical protein PMI04_004595 [Sphingobium sp. AP49]